MGYKYIRIVLCYISFQNVLWSLNVQQIILLIIVSVFQRFGASKTSSLLILGEYIWTSFSATMFPAPLIQFSHSSGLSLAQFPSHIDAHSWLCCPLALPHALLIRWHAWRRGAAAGTLATDLPLFPESWDVSPFSRIWDWVLTKTRWKKEKPVWPVLY